MIGSRPEVEGVSFRKLCTFSFQHDPLLHLRTSAVIKHTDPLILEVSTVDLQKVVHSSSDDIISFAKITTTELLLHLEEEVAVVVEVVV